MAEEEEARTAIGSSMRDIELRQAARAESFQKFSAKLEEDLVKLQASLDRAVQAASSSPSNLQLPANVLKGTQALGKSIIRDIVSSASTTSRRYGMRPILPVKSLG
mmetsp:Transcript_51821/g.86104  ORF Transcript_51821/g.86104 Transcript_51821/m.86104 type:complete len:106 (+) Transcript_51821:660-977(+)